MIQLRLLFVITNNLIKYYVYLLHLHAQCEIRRYLLNKHTQTYMYFFLFLVLKKLIFSDLSEPIKFLPSFRSIFLSI